MLAALLTIWSMATQVNEAHELDDRPQPHHRRADAEPGEAGLADRRVDDALGAELLEHALADLVGAVVLGDFLAHEEDVLVALHLLGHRLAEGFANCITGIGSNRPLWGLPR